MELLRRLMERGGTDDGQADTAMQMVAASPDMQVLDAGDQPEPAGLAAARSLLRQYTSGAMDPAVDVEVGEPQLVRRKPQPVKSVDVQMGKVEMQPRPAAVDDDLAAAERITRSRYPAVDVRLGEPRVTTRVTETDEPDQWQSLVAALGLDG